MGLELGRWGGGGVERGPSSLSFIQFYTMFCGAFLLSLLDSSILKESVFKLSAV